MALTKEEIRPRARIFAAIGIASETAGGQREDHPRTEVRNGAMEEPPSNNYVSAMGVYIYI